MVISLAVWRTSLCVCRLESSQMEPRGGKGDDAWDERGKGENYVRAEKGRAKPQGGKGGGITSVPPSEALRSGPARIRSRSTTEAKSARTRPRTHLLLLGRGRGGRLARDVVETGPERGEHEEERRGPADAEVGAVQLRVLGVAVLARQAGDPASSRVVSKGVHGIREARGQRKRSGCGRRRGRRKKRTSRDRQSPEGNQRTVRGTGSQRRRRCCG